MSEHKVITKKFYSSNCFELTIEKNNIDFKPGACASILHRTYSFCSSPNDDYIRFIIRKFDDGEITPKLSLLNPGDIITIDEVFRYFNIDEHENDYCFIATGTGIAPFISALKTYNKKPQTILYGAKTYDDLYLRYELKNLCDDTHFAVSKPSFEGKPRRVTELLDKLPINDKTTYYLCGIEGMLVDVSNYLMNKGVTYEQIQQELFYI